MGPKPNRYILTDTDTIPVWVRVRNRLQCVSRQAATHMLLDVLESDGFNQPHVKAFRTVSYTARALIVPWGKWSLVYVAVDSAITGTTPAYKRHISVAYSQVENYVYNTPTINDTLCELFQPDSTARPKKFPPMPEYDRSKITATHHTHLRPSEVIEAAKRVSNIRYYYCRVMVERLRQANITYEATVSTFLTYVLGCAGHIAELLIDSNYVWNGCNNITELHDRLKAVSGQIKSLNASGYEDLTELFEMNVLVNRGVGSVNWCNEKRNRVQPNVANVDPTKVYEEVRKMFVNARKTYKYPKMTYDEYLSKRWEWVPSGSVHSQYEDDTEYDIPGIYTKTKFVTVNRMPASHLRKFVSGVREIRAWKSTKYEWGKQRAIYGTDLRSTVLTNFAMYRCEEVLSTLFPVGSEAESAKVHKRISMMLGSGESFCFDYDDFNSQHSLSSMYAVLCAFTDEFKDEMSDDQFDAMLWVRESVKNMYVKEDDNSWYKLQGTLLSGWRLTTFMNTILNWVYMKVAGVFDLDDVQDSVHNGDDVMIALTKPSTAVKIMTLMDKINARAQVSKCNLATVAEFLRVEHGAIGADGLGAQYLTRACATLCHSRVESREPVSLKRLLEADRTRLSEYRGRASESRASDSLAKELVSRASNIFRVSMDTINHILRLHRVVGGINDGRWADIDMKVVHESDDVRIPEETGDPSSWPGVRDYTSQLYVLFDKLIPSNKLLKAVTQGTKQAVAMPTKESIGVIKNKDVETSEWERAMYGTYKSIRTTYYASMSRFASIPPIRNAEKGEAWYYISAVKASVNKLRAMQILA